MTMRAPSSELPIVFDGVTVTAGGVTILDNIALSAGCRARRRC